MLAECDIRLWWTTHYSYSPPWSHLVMRLGCRVRSNWCNQSLLKWFHRLASIYDYKFSQFQPSNFFIKLFIANVLTTVLWSSFWSWNDRRYLVWLISGISIQFSVFIMYSQSVLDVPWRRPQHCGRNVGNEDFDEKIAWLELRKHIITIRVYPWSES